MPKGEPPAAFAKGDSPDGFAAPKPPEFEFANAPKPPPEAAAGDAKELKPFPGVDGCPKADPVLIEPKPGFPNGEELWPKGLEVPNPGCDGFPNAPAPPPNEGVPKAGFWAPAKADGVPKAGF